MQCCVANNPVTGPRPMCCCCCHTAAKLAEAERQAHAKDMESANSAVGSLQVRVFSITAEKGPLLQAGLLFCFLVKRVVNLLSSTIDLSVIAVTNPFYEFSMNKVSGQCDARPTACCYC